MAYSIFIGRATPDQPKESIMTKLDLLARAKALGIKGRHDMAKSDLEVAVAQREQIQQVSDAAKQAAQDIKAETKPTRRRGSNFNTPWAPKFYYVDVARYEAAKTEGSVAKAPMQVQLMLRFMVDRGISSRSQAQRGSSISTVAVSSGFVKTVIEPHVLFAYYVRRMEALGLVFAGYDLDGEDDMEAEAEAADEAALEDETETSEDEGE
jgi:hypothetical protein